MKINDALNGLRKYNVNGVQYSPGDEVVDVPKGKRKMYEQWAIGGVPVLVGEWSDDYSELEADEADDNQEA